MKVCTSMEQLIGRTPIMELCRVEKRFALEAKIFAKLEAFNPAGSVKDRVGLSMILDAEARGVLAKGGVIIEPTSGNTGIGLCAVAAARGYRAVIVMPDSMSKERRQLMTAYGAELVLTPGAQGMTGAIKKAEELQKELPGSIVAGQFVNPANPKAHYTSTAPEIYADMDGLVDCFVAGVGTGGTITGIGRFLKEKKPAVRVVAVEPADSAVLSGQAPGAHKLQGIGAGFVPKILDLSVIDEVIPVKNEDAYRLGALMGRLEGVLVGISSGAALCAAIELAKRKEYAGKNIVVLFPDSGDHYLSTPGYLD